ncbi:MAG: SDR family oxidoreductase [Myxococcales bacterium]|nr:SDR family oxidoreductase [Myxococcales bacterium]
MWQKKFTGKSAIVTGGSSGIGKALASQLTKLGCDVVIVARRASLLEETLAELETLRQRPEQKLLMRALDISDREAVEAGVTELLATLGKIDYLFNNAGVAYCHYFEETSPDVFEKMMNINYFGTVWMTRAVLPVMRTQGAGHIVNVTSILGVMSIVGYTAYAASKYALHGFSETLRNELADTPIRLSLVMPPDTDTPQYEEENKTKPPETKALAGNAKLMSAEEVAEMTLRGVAAGRYHILPGKMDLKFIHFAASTIPGVVRYFVDSDIRKFRKKMLKEKRG